MKQIKIYVTGPFNAGKTTLIHRLAPNATSIEHYYKDGTSTTVGFDLGTIYWDSKRNLLLRERPETSVDENSIYKVILVGTPGQMRFAPVREILAKGCQGILFIIDSTNLGQIGVALAMYEEVKSYFRGNKIPMLILANKQDLENAASAEDIAKLLKIDDVKIMEVSALKEINIENAIIELLNMIMSKIDTNNDSYTSYVRIRVS